MRIARGELDVDEASAEVREVLDRCDELRRQTGGAFDVRATGQLAAPHRPGWCAIDPSGFVKGWALDRAAAMLTRSGATRLCINAGGDVVVRGEQPWRVGIQHPYVHDQLACVVSIATGGVATSGRYERGDHVVDPRTGRPATGLVAATVIADELAVADAWATAIVALGSDGEELLRDCPDVAAMAITDDGRIVRTAGFERHLVARVASR